jgi:hypothetical protein
LARFKYKSRGNNRHAASRSRWFKIDSLAPTSTLLPIPPKASAKLPLWTNEDLAQVADLTIGEPITQPLTKENALAAIAHMICLPRS